MTVVIVPTLLLWVLIALFALNAVAAFYKMWLQRKLAAREKARPVAWTPAKPMMPLACWCAACDAAQSQFRFRMNLCPECGDKRCPRAEHHGNECSKTPNVRAKQEPTHDQA